MKEYIVGTFNLKNNYCDKNWEYENYAKKLSEYILDNKITILAVQELVKKYSNSLLSNLKSQYNIYGEYRFKNNKLTDKLNESVAIISNIPPTSIDNKYLSKFPLFPRIMTIYKIDNLTILNVHLEFWSNYYRKKELAKIYKYINENINENIIILGDFNMEATNKYPYFIKFINNLSKKEINIVKFDQNTYKNKIIDHIFVSSKLEVINTWSDNYLDDLSDHKPLFIKVKIK